MVAGENPKAPGIIRNRFVKSKLGGEICHRPLNRSAGSHFSVSVLARKIIPEGVVDLLQFTKKGFVLCELFQARLPRELQHAHRVVIGAVPEIGIEMTKKPSGGRLPCPPEIESHLP